VCERERTYTKGSRRVAEVTGDARDQRREGGDESVCVRERENIPTPRAERELPRFLATLETS